MSLISFFRICLSLVFLMPTLIQPLRLGLCIIFLSALSCVLLGLTVSSWFGYVLFLVFVGGLLVIFAYVSALTPNNYFSSIKPFIIFVFYTLAIFLFCLSSDMLSPAVLTWRNLLSIKKTTLLSGQLLVNPRSISLIVILGTILLINLLAVVKICYYQQGPLRPHSELK